MTDRELMQRALEALERYRIETPLGHQPHMLAEEADNAITALRERLAQPESCDPQIVWCDCGDGITPNSGAKCGNCLAAEAAWAQPEQEPVAWMSPGRQRLEFAREDTVYGSHTIPLYTTPPRREWQGLTEDEFMQCQNAVPEWMPADAAVRQFGGNVEDKLREKNA